MDRATAARLAGMDRQTLRDWVHRCNAEGIAGLCNRPAPGRKPKLTEGQMAALKAVVLAGPDPAVDKIERWRIVDLCRWVEARWDVSYSETGMLRLCRGHRARAPARAAWSKLEPVRQWRPESMLELMRRIRWERGWQGAGPLCLPKGGAYGSITVIEVGGPGV